MKDNSQARTTLVCCSVFRAEVESLAIKHWPDVAFCPQDSMLHMKPAKLADRLILIVDEALARGHRVVLIYGDCCEQMAALEARPGVVRTRGFNCCDLLLGRDEYHRLRNDGAFFLFPEWTRRWRHIFSSELGLNHDNATSLMQDMHRKLIYLDTGLVPAPTEVLRECAQYCGLPFEVRAVSLVSLRAAIEEALNKLDTTSDPA